MQPTKLSGSEVTLRPMRYRDKSQWNRVRAENREWLDPWEATLPNIPAGSPAYEDSSARPSFFQMVSLFRREARSGRSYSFLIWHNENLVGQMRNE